MVSSERKALAEKVIDLLHYHVYPFGGYLRDEIAGEDFKDLDLFFPKPTAGYPDNRGITSSDLWRHLRSYGLQVTVLDSSDIYNFTSAIKLRKTKAEVLDPITGAIIEIDLIRSDAIRPEEDHPFIGLDADVNSLYRARAGQRVGALVSKNGDLNKIKQNIANRVFELPTNQHVDVDRIAKLFARGYKVKKNTNDPPLKGDERKTTVNQEIGFMQMMKTDMEEAAYQASGEQATKGVKAGILALLKDQGMDSTERSVAAKMLDTELGSSFIAVMMGVGLNYAPVIGKDPRVTKLAKGLRVGGGAKGMNVAFGALMQYIMPAIMQAVSSLPPISEEKDLSKEDRAELDRLQNKKVRVNGTEEVPVDFDEEEEIPSLRSARS